MQYKTMVLQLLQQQPQMHEQLRRRRMLLPTLELFANELKSRHDMWKEQLSQAKPGSDPSQIASEALELALHDLTRILLPDSKPSDETFPIDEAMAFLRSEPE
jgi:hypothetical protein